MPTVRARMKPTIVPAMSSAEPMTTRMCLVTSSTMAGE
jgi:hypothetical protein